MANLLSKLVLLGALTLTGCNKIYEVEEKPIEIEKERICGTDFVQANDIRARAYSKNGPTIVYIKPKKKIINNEAIEQALGDRYK